MSVTSILMQRFSAVASVLETDDLHTVSDKLSLHGVGAVVVLSTAGGLVGIISDRDVVQALSRRRDAFDQLTAADIMSTEVFTCTPEDTELELMAVMTERHIRHMPVMLGEKVVGLVTLEDAVKHRLEKIGRLTERATAESDGTTRLAMLEKHLKENLSIFEVFRAVIGVQEEVGLAELEPRSREMLWVIGEAERQGQPLQLKDLMKGHRWGAYPTVKRHLAELSSSGWITQSGQEAGWKGKPFILTDRGQQAFARMASAMSQAVLPTV